MLPTFAPSPGGAQGSHHVTRAVQTNPNAPCSPQALTQCQKTLTELSCVMELEVAPGAKEPHRLRALRPLEPRDLILLKQRSQAPRGRDT